MDRDFAKFMGGFLGLVIGVLGATFGLIYQLESWQCTGYQTATGKATKYVRAECYVKDDGAWYSWTEYKNRLIARGQMAH